MHKSSFLVRSAKYSVWAIIIAVDHSFDWIKVLVAVETVRQNLLILDHKSLTDTCSAGGCHCRVVDVGNLDKLRPLHLLRKLVHGPHSFLLLLSLTWLPVGLSYLSTLNHCRRMHLQTNFPPVAIPTWIHQKNHGTTTYHSSVGDNQCIGHGMILSGLFPLGTIFLMLAPHPSLLYVLVDFHLQTLQKPFLFVIHLFVTYTLTFLAFSSLIVCVARDPGPVTSSVSPERGSDEVGLMEALMPDIDFSAPTRWCRKCWVSFSRPILYFDLPT